MSTLPTYQFYSEVYYGKNSEAAFNSSLRCAASKVRNIIWPNEVTEDTEEAYQLAVCAAIDVDIAYGGSGGIGEDVGSLSIGSFSISGGNANTSSYASDMEQAIREQLVGTGLLYMGIE